MPADDVEAVRRLVDAWNRDDWDGMTAALNPDVIGVPPEGWPEGGETADGADALLRQFGRLKDSWEEERLDVDEIREGGGEVVVSGHWVTRGHNSGIEMQVPVTIRATVREGKLSRAEFRVDDAAARPPDAP